MSLLQVVDCPDLPALICNNCVKDLSIAAKFRNSCRSTDSKIKSKLLPFEIAKWVTELQILRNLEVKQDETAVVVKVEPIETQNDTQPDQFLEFLMDYSSAENDDGPPEEPEKPKTTYTCEKCGHVSYNRKNYRYHQQLKHTDKYIYTCHVSSTGS